MAAGWVYPFIPKTDMLAENNNSFMDIFTCTHTYRWPRKHISERTRDIYLMFYLVNVRFFFSNGSGIKQQ